MGRTMAAGPCAIADWDDSGQVDLVDLAMMAASWLTCTDPHSIRKLDRKLVHR